MKKRKITGIVSKEFLIVTGNCFSGRIDKIHVMSCKEVLKQEYGISF
jgi:hypothetical protein